MQNRVKAEKTFFLFDEFIVLLKFYIAALGHVTLFIIVLNLYAVSVSFHAKLYRLFKFSYINKGTMKFLMVMMTELEGEKCLNHLKAPHTQKKDNVFGCLTMIILFFAQLLSLSRT